MKWRVMVEVTGKDGAVMRHLISEGERTGAGQAATLGLSLAEGKATLAGLQRPTPCPASAGGSGTAKPHGHWP